MKKRIPNGSRWKDANRTVTVERAGRYWVDYALTVRGAKFEGSMKRGYFLATHTKADK